MPMKILTGLIYIIIFLTGGAGLIYQVTWQKYLSRLLGSDSIATAIILAVFLGGLSVGYLLCGKISSKIKNNFKAYAVAEGIIGAWCLLFPKMFHLVEDLTASWSFSAPAVIIFQGVFCSAVLMGVPTICMGATIPFLTRGISRSLSEATHVHAKVYAINTGGAFLGTLLAGFFLIPAFGLPLTIIGTSMLNLLAFVGIFVIQKWIVTDAGLDTTANPLTENAVEQNNRSNDQTISPYTLSAIAFLSGFYVMTLENVLIRITNLSLGSSSYTFTLIISVFILSIAIGSYLVGRLKTLSPRTLFINQLFITLSLLLVYISLDSWPYWSHILRISFQSNIMGFWLYYGSVFIMLLMVLIFPIGLMGATVPITFHELKRDLALVGKHSGYLFSLNTLGSLCGSLIGGIVFYYFFNNGRVFLIAIALAGLSTYLASKSLPKMYIRWSQALVAVLTVFCISGSFFSEHNFSIGAFRFREPLPTTFDGPSVFYDFIKGKSKIAYYNDGPSASVAAVEWPSKKDAPKSMSIYVNGKSDSNTWSDAYTLRLSAHIPALLAKKRKRAMVVGLGTGVTAAELALYPEIEHIDVAEISSSVIEALPYFSEYTQNVHENDKVKIHLADAFRLLGRGKGKYDLIISEPSNPWVTGVDQLFTKEFYRLADSRLTDDGLILQWVHLYATNENMVGMILNTINQMFDHFHAFIAGEGDLVLLISKKQITLEDLERARSSLNNIEAVKASLSDLNLNSIESILLREVWPSSYIKSEMKGYGIQTMDNPRLHYLAGKCFFEGKFANQNFYYNHKTAKYTGSYLLPKLHPNLFSNDNAEMFQSMLKSMQFVGKDRSLTSLKSFKLKRSLMESYSTSGLEKEKLLKGIRLIHLIEKYPEDEGEWDTIGLGDHTIREKASLMIKHVETNRDWLVPFSIEGLIELLRRGIETERDEYDQNWCRLQLALIFTAEDGNTELARTILKGVRTDKDGKLLIRDKDIPLAKAAEDFIVDVEQSKGI